MRSLVWFRRDLRTADNWALSQATHESSQGVMGLFVITPKQWKEHDDADCKVSFWIRNLRCLSRELARLRIPLLVATCDTFADVPAIVVSVARQHGCSRLYWNREYEVHESRRDAKVVTACQQANLQACQFDDRIIVPPGKILTKEGRYYSVFSAFRRVWDTQAREYAAPLPAPRQQPAGEERPSPIPDHIPGFDFRTTFATCGRQARRRLISGWPASERS